MSEITLTFPLSYAPNGTIATTTDYFEQWADKVILAVGTSLGERPFKPSFGSSLGKATFENIEDVEMIATETVRSAFARYLPYLSLTGVDVYQDFTEDGSSKVEIDIAYIVPNGEEVVSTLTYGTIGQTGDFYDGAQTVPLDNTVNRDELDED